MIWEFPYLKGALVCDFNGLESMAMDYSGTLFQKFEDVNIAKVLKISSYFPKMVNENLCEQLYKPMSRDELLHVLGTFSKDNIPGHDGWIDKFYIDFFDLLGEDLL